MKVTPEQIVATALELLDEVGLDALTTRLLAQRLGVQQPALYWHFKNRRALLDAMNDAMMAPFHGMAAPTDDWNAYVFAIGQQFRAALMSRRDGARVHAGTPVNRALYEKMMGVLVGGGLPLHLAVDLSVAVGRLTVGWAMEEQADTTPRSAPPIPEDGLAGAAIRTFAEGGETRAYEAGLRFLIAGAAAQLTGLDG